MTLAIPNLLERFIKEEINFHSLFGNIGKYSRMDETDEYKEQYNRFIKDIVIPNIPKLTLISNHNDQKQFLLSMVSKSNEINQEYHYYMCEKFIYEIINYGELNPLINKRLPELYIYERNVFTDQEYNKTIVNLPDDTIKAIIDKYNEYGVSIGNDKLLINGSYLTQLKDTFTNEIFLKLHFPRNLTVSNIEDKMVSKLNLSRKIIVVGRNIFETQVYLETLLPILILDKLYYYRKRPILNITQARTVHYNKSNSELYDNILMHTPSTIAIDRLTDSTVIDIFNLSNKIGCKLTTTYISSSISRAKEEISKIIQGFCSSDDEITWIFVEKENSELKVREFIG